MLPNTERDSSCALSNGTANAKLARRLDDLRTEIQKLSHSFRNRVQSPASSERRSVDNNSNIISNLEGCLQSASNYVAGASTIVSSLGGSDVFTDTPGSRVRNWIQQTAEIPPEEDLEIVIIQSLLNWATSKLNRKEYAEAESTLRRVLERSRLKYGEQFEGKHQALEMLATACQRQRKWKEARDILLELWQNRGNMEAIEISYALAEVFMAEGDLSNAEKYCLLAVRQGRQHKLFHQFTSLLVSIYENKGHLAEAEAFKRVLPATIQGMQTSHESHLLKNVFQLSNCAV